MFFVWGIGRKTKGIGEPYNAVERYAGARGCFLCGELEGELKEMVDRITQRSVTPERGVFCVWGKLEGELKEMVNRITQRSVTPERGVFFVWGIGKKTKGIGGP